MRRNFLSVFYGPRPDDPIALPDGLQNTHSHNHQSPNHKPYTVIMPSANAILAALFQQMADLTTITDESSSAKFRVNAYAKAARVIDDLTVDLSSMDRDVATLTKIDGIGKGTAERIVEFLNTGRIDDHQKLLAQVPDGLTDLLDIQGLGPKKVALLWRDGGVNNIDDLTTKLQGDELATLPGMGKKTLENLRKSIAFASKSAERVRIDQAMLVAEWFVEHLRAIKHVKQCDYAGSLRRGRETIGDVDLLVAVDAKHAAAIHEAFVTAEPVAEVQAHGETKSSIRTHQGLQVDLRVVLPDQYGAALMYFTGSKDHNVRLRQRAIERDMSLNEYGLTRDDKKTVVASKTEQAIYEALDLPWLPPELREDRGELDYQKTPVLVELSDLKAELHAHTFASDGKWSIEELAQGAADRGFHTVAVTDHSRSQAQANGLTAERLEQHIKAVHAARDALKKQDKNAITILAGSEVDILADGSLDYPDELLAELDIVVASPHNALTQDPSKATARLLRAIENPYVTIIGHPTGRLINRREGLSPDMNAIIKAAAERGIALEINANAYRLDLRDTHVRAAIEAGVMLSINCDSHGPADLDQARYGVLTARRGGAQSKHIINCMTRDALAKWLSSARG